MKRRFLVLALFVLAMAIGTSLTFMLLLRGQQKARKLTVSAEHPIWTASLSGTSGDSAEIWIWTSSATLRTNLPLPVTLKLDRRSLFLAVRSQRNRDLALDINGLSSASAHVRLQAGQTNTAVFLSHNWIPWIPPTDSSVLTFPAGAPLEVMPVYGRFWNRRTLGFAAVKNAVITKPGPSSP